MVASFRSLPVLSLPGRPRLRWAVRLLCWVLFTSGHAGDFDELKAQLRLRDKWERKSAVEGLARLGTPRAWELVIEALQDERGEVSDTAQWVLGELTDRKLIAKLARRDGLTSKDPWIRERTTELFGRLVAANDIGPLLGQLDDREVRVRQAALLALGTRIRAGQLEGGDAKRIAKYLRVRYASDRDPHVRGQALAVLCASGEADEMERFDILRKSARNREAAVRAVTATLLLDVEDDSLHEGRFVLLGKLVEDSARVVRAKAIETCARIACKHAAGLLIERIGHEANARLRRRIVQLLQKISGTKHREDPRPWQAWLQRLPEDWKGRYVGNFRLDVAGKDARGRLRSAVTPALPVLSDRLSFLIDLSGSIWQVRSDGKTKKEKVDEKLREALGRLPEDARFNVIPFTSHPLPWKERLMKANRRNVAMALRSFEDLRESGSGNIWDAIQLALQDPETDTLILLTDGAPTGGRRHRLELILPMLLHQNATRGVTFDVVLVGASRKLENYWRTLAEGSGGALVSIEL